MSKLGDLLRETREASSYTIDEISSNLKINKNILELLEKGNFTSLPSYVHASGFVRKYAEFLGLDAEQIKLLFSEECKKEDFITGDSFIAHKVSHQQVDKQPKYKIIIPVFILIILILIVSYFKFVNSKAKDITLKKNENIVIENKEKNISDNNSKPVIVINVNNTSDNISDNITKKTNNKLQENKKEKVVIEKKQEVKQLSVKIEKPDKTVKMYFSDACWIALNIDNNSYVDFIAQAGDTKTVKFKNFFLLDIGNAAAISLKYKNETIGGFGGFGQPKKNLKFYLDKEGKLVYSKIK